MKVRVTPAQFAWIQEQHLVLGVTRDPKVADSIIGMLSGCALDHGDDFVPQLARMGHPTELEVIYGVE